MNATGPSVSRVHLFRGALRCGTSRRCPSLTSPIIARDWEAVGRADAEAFGAVRPATTMVEVRALIEPWMRVEIEVDAVVG